MEYSKSTFLSMGEKIISARKERGLSQAAFIDLLGENGVKIARNRLSKIENGEEGHFSLDFLLAVCRLFGWDMGYLFGEYEEKTKEKHLICQRTGLSEKAVDKLLLLKEYNSREWHIDTINGIMENENFIDFVVSATNYAFENTDIEIIPTVHFASNSVNSRDVCSLKCQRLLFKMLDDIPPKAEDYRNLYSLLYSLRKNGMSEKEFQERIAKLDKGDLSDWRDEQ